MLTDDRSSAPGRQPIARSADELLRDGGDNRQEGADQDGEQSPLGNLTSDVVIDLATVDPSLGIPYYRPRPPAPRSTTRFFFVHQRFPSLLRRRTDHLDDFEQPTGPACSVAQQTFEVARGRDPCDRSDRRGGDRSHPAAELAAMKLRSGSATSAARRGARRRQGANGDGRAAELTYTATQAGGHSISDDPSGHDRTIDPAVGSTVAVGAKPWSLHRVTTTRNGTPATAPGLWPGNVHRHDCSPVDNRDPNCGVSFRLQFTLE
jgi:hypothetical protein